MTRDQVSAAMKLANAGLKMLALRLHSLLALLATAAMFGYAVAEPDSQRTIAASLFALFAGWVFLIGREKVTIAPPPEPPENQG